MPSILGSMSEILGKLAIVLSEMLVVDVSIVDVDMVRIAGTGHFKETVGKSIVNEGNILKSVLSEKKQVIIENPRENPICADCYNKENCKETFEMSTPIYLNGEVIGGIGFVSFSEDQRNYLLSHYSSLSSFLNHTSDLIASKAAENITNAKNQDYIKILSHVFNKVNEGVIVTDSDNKLLCHNDMASMILNIELSNKLGHIFELILSEHQLFEYDRCEIKYDDHALFVAGKFYPSQDNQKLNTLVFRDIPSLKQDLLSSPVHSKHLNKIIGNSDSIKQIKEKIKLIADSSSTVLITGESGTGKELLANAIHYESPRKEEAFVAINCGAIPENLFESELFGYVRGAFTGADPKGKIGKLELADQGTLFLDEIGDMPLHVQVKLLRALENKSITQLGSNTSVDIDIRIIAATNKDLKSLIDQGLFREDLYYRLNVIPLVVPPLRERIEDLDKLTDFFISKFSEIFGKHITNINKDYYQSIRSYDWPGNIRELQNAIEYSINLVQEPYILEDKHLPARLKNKSPDKAISNYNLEAMEKEIITACIKEFSHLPNYKQLIADKLGIGIATLYRKLKKFQIDLSK